MSASASPWEAALEGRSGAQSGSASPRESMPASRIPPTPSGRVSASVSVSGSGSGSVSQERVRRPLPGAERRARRPRTATRARAPKPPRRRSGFPPRRGVATSRPRLRSDPRRPGKSRDVPGLREAAPAGPGSRKPRSAARPSPRGAGRPPLRPSPQRAAPGRNRPWATQPVDLAGVQAGRERSSARS